MAKKKGNLYGKVIEYTRTENGTSIGRKPKLSSMNKHKRRMRGKSKDRGQGKWQSDLCSILMESSYLIKCHKIIDQQKKEREAVARVDFFQINMASVVSIELKELKMFIPVTNGELDILKDNGTYYT